MALFGEKASAMLRAMATWFACSYLGADVELTDEREEHILAQHADMRPYMDRIAATLTEPDMVYRSRRGVRTRRFYRWYDDDIRGKYVVAVVVSDAPPAGRKWVVTAYIARRATGGTLEWAKS